MTGQSSRRDFLGMSALGVAWHGYAGTPEMMSKVQEAFPGVEMYWTEGGPDYRDPGYLTDWWMTFRNCWSVHSAWG
jgi:hypothetical protein